MNRLELITKLFTEKTNTTMVFSEYLSTPREYLPGSKLYMREVHFIMAISPETGSTATEIANKLDVTLGAVSQLAQRLEKKGFIERAKSSHDKRQTIVTLTDIGNALYQEHEEYDKARFTAAQDYFKNFTDEQLLEFLKYEKLMREIYIEYFKSNDLI